MIHSDLLVMFRYPPIVVPVLALEGIASFLLFVKQEG
mgnify:CR=1 FL=1|jgi:hypothetical protein